MSITYRVAAGDTLDAISRKNYGSEAYAQRIAKANPGTANPPTPGSVIIIPDITELPKNQAYFAPTASADEVAIIVDGVRFSYWSEVQITIPLDGIATADFSAPFDHLAPGFRDVFRPFAFKPVLVTVGGLPVFTGTMVAVTPRLAGENKTISASCYSTPGVLADCTPPADADREFSGVGLREISKELCDPFGIKVEFQADPGSVFEQVAISSEQKILDFLTGLAKERGLIVASSATGSLVFKKPAATGAPVAILRHGQPPLLSVTPTFSPQEYYSHITGIEPMDVGTDGSKFTIKNDRLAGVLRPLVFTIDNTESGDVRASVEAKAGRMFGNAATYQIEVSTMRDPSGVLWAEGATLKLQAPDAMIYSEYEFEIRTVTLRADRASRTASLSLAIPGSFAGIIPKALPWG